MEQILQKVNDGFRWLCDWCASNKKVALAAAASVVLLVMMMSVMFCGSRKIASGTDEAGGVTWTYRANGTLSFSGDGEVVGQKTTYSDRGTTVEQPEWYEYRDEVIAVEIGEGITYVGVDSFVEFPSLRTVTVSGQTTELDIECIRYETGDGWKNFSGITIYGTEGSGAQSYAEFSGLNYSLLQE